MSSALCESRFPYCSENAVQANFCLCFHTLPTFIHTDRHLSWIYLLIKRKPSVLLLLMKCCSSPVCGGVTYGDFFVVA